MTRHAGIFIIEKLSDCSDEAKSARPWMVSYNVKDPASMRSSMVLEHRVVVVSYRMLRKRRSSIMFEEL